MQYAYTAWRFIEGSLERKKPVKQRGWSESLLRLNSGLEELLYFTKKILLGKLA